MGKKTVLIAIIVVLLLAAGFFGYNYFRGPAKAEPPKKKMMVKAGEFITNLAGNDKRFVKVQIDVETESEEAGKELISKSSQMRDQVLSVLRSKTAAELSGPDGMRLLSQDILDKVNTLLASGKALGIYFTDFAIQ